MKSNNFRVTWKRKESAYQKCVKKCRRRRSTESHCCALNNVELNSYYCLDKVAGSFCWLLASNRRIYSVLSVGYRANCALCCRGDAQVTSTQYVMWQFAHIYMFNHRSRIRYLSKKNFANFNEFSQIKKIRKNSYKNSLNAQVWGWIWCVSRFHVNKNIKQTYKAICTLQWSVVRINAL